MQLRRPRPSGTMAAISLPVSYTHLRAHETDTSLFVGQRQMCIRDRSVGCHEEIRSGMALLVTDAAEAAEAIGDYGSDLAPCLLYTSPSPRDGHLSIRRAASDVYKRQVCRMSRGDPIRDGAARDRCS